MLLPVRFLEELSFVAHFELSSPRLSPITHMYAYAPVNRPYL
jgi:hypothetical protein